MLAERFRAASDRPPLSALCPADRRELAALLEQEPAFEELPGRWQAALLGAEGPGAAASPDGGCCGRAHASPPAGE